MALLGKKKKADKAETTKKVEKAEKAPAKKKAEKVTEDLSWVVIGPRITEKAAMITSDNAYAFDVAVRANKIQIKKAIASQYKVTVTKVNVINAKPRKVMKRGRKVHQSGTKKAMVFLKKGDTINLA